MFGDKAAQTFVDEAGEAAEELASEQRYLRCDAAIQLQAVIRALFVRRRISFTLAGNLTSAGLVPLHPLGEGGFGQVYEARCGQQNAAVQRQPF